MGLFVDRIELADFRNYERLSLELGRGLNVICGDNAQGKTNILEAVFLCSSGKSHRTAKDADMVRMGAGRFSVELAVEKIPSRAEIKICYETGIGKTISVNGVRIAKMGQLMGNLCSVIFSPEDLSIIKEGPAERRRFIDIFLCQTRPAYFYDLQQCLRILKQKNILLRKTDKSRGAIVKDLETWNTGLAGTGARVMAARKAFIDRLNTAAREMHRKISEGKEELSVKYKPSVAVDFSDGPSLESIQDIIGKSLEKIAERETMLGTTLLGPQKDDIEIHINGVNLKTYGSQGQQRTAALSMKIAEVEIIRQDMGETPVLLLDDVLSELDQARQRFLLENIGETQTIITSTDRQFSCGIPCDGARTFMVENGKVFQLEN